MVSTVPVDSRNEAQIEPTLARLVGDCAPRMPSQLHAPNVSVIVTAYNAAPFLLETLESVREQTLPFLECIIVDDASKDDTRSVVEAFLAQVNDARFCLLCRDENGGQLAAQITGFNASRGEFVVFLDADDLLYRDCLEAQLAAHLSSVPIVPLVCLDAATIDAHSALLSAHHREMKPHIWELTHAAMRPTTVQIGGELVKARLILPSAANRLSLVDEYLWTSQSFIMFRADALRLILPDTTKYFRICADYFLLGMSHAFNCTLLVERQGGAYRLHGSNGFSHPRLISAEMESSSSIVANRQHEDMRQLAAEVVLERIEEFASLWGSFKVMRALLSVQRAFARPMRHMMVKQYGLPYGVALYGVAVCSSLVTRLRKTARKMARIILRGR